MSRTRANLLLLIAGALWGMGFVAQSTAMDKLGPLTFVGLRFAAATLAMLPFALREHRAGPPLGGRDWLRFAGIGVLLFGGMIAQQTGLITTSVTNSGFLTGTYVVMVPFLAVLIYRQWPHPAVWPGAALTLAGIWLLSGGTIATLTTGDWLTLLCALFWALQVLFIARFAADTGRPVTLAVVQFAVCGALALAGALAFETFDAAAIVAAAPEILYAGIFSGGIAFTLQVVGQRYTTAPQAAIFLSTEAVFAALFGAIFLHERLPPAGLAGCALIFVAILVVELLPQFAARGRRATP
ncbi:MAG: DMT family transporter [Rhizobiales bacterium]|nr:DMT family transporter [Hyphomicrobiales bacterium]OJU35026.1 MAG: MFS transporter [Rhizobiales bacterium 68-8]